MASYDRERVLTPRKIRRSPVQSQLSDRLRSQRTRRRFCLALEHLESRTLLTYDFSPVVELGNFVKAGGITASAVAEDQENDIVVAGTFSQSWNFNPKGAAVNVSSGGLTDGFVAKYGPDGNYKWVSHYFVNGGNSQANAVTIDANGDVIVVGAKNQQLFVEKLDALTGIMRWTRQFDAGIGNGVAVDNSGDIYVVGTFSVEMTFTQGGPATRGHGNSNDIFVLKLSGATGSTMWGTTLGGNYSDEGLGIAVDSNKNFFVSGQYQYASNYGAAYLVKYDANGRMDWSRTYTANTNGLSTLLDVAQSVATDSQGNALVYGYYSGSVDFSPGAVGVLNSLKSTSQFVLKVDPLGNSIWRTDLAAEPSTWGGGIALDSSGNSYVASDASINLSNSRTEYGLLEAKLSPGGSVVASHFYGQIDAGEPAAGGIAINSAGTVAIAGSYQHSFPMGSATLPVVQDYGSNMFLATSLAPPKTPTITWPAPADIPYGTALGPDQLNASSNVPGTFKYTPAAGTVLAAGKNQTLSVTFTPEDKLAYTTATATRIISIQQATPSITWAAPANIYYGTPIGLTQLDATANVPGTFTYTPPDGTILGAGVNQTLSVTFTPVDLANYTTASAATSINVDRATPTIFWSAPGDITYGDSLSTVQLNATASVPGTFVYVPAIGTVLQGGSGQTLSVMFTPSDVGNYVPTTSSTTINIQRATPRLTWPTPATISVGTPLGAGQLNAKSNVPGTFTYSPGLGVVLGPALNQLLSVSFVPTDITDYSVASMSVMINVRAASRGPQTDKEARIQAETMVANLGSARRDIRSEIDMVSSALRTAKARLRRDQRLGSSNITGDLAAVSALASSLTQLSVVTRKLDNALTTDKQLLKKLDKQVTKRSIISVFEEQYNNPASSPRKGYVHELGVSSIVKSIFDAILSSYGSATKAAISVLALADSALIKSHLKSPDLQVDRPPAVIEVKQDSESINNPGQFTISNDGSSFRDISAAVSISGELTNRVLLNVVSSNVSLSQNGSTVVNFVVDTRNLGVGTHTARVILTDDKVEADTCSIPITVKVLPANHPNYDLAAQVSADKPIVTPGQEVTYRFTYQNVNGDDSSNATMTATIPDGLSIKSFNSTTGKFQRDGNVLKYTGPLPKDHPVELTVVCSVDSSAPNGTVNVSGEVEPANFFNDTDTNPANDKASVETTISSSSSETGLIGTWTSSYSGFAKDSDNNIVPVSGDVTLAITGAILNPDLSNITIVGTLTATGFLGQTISGSIVGINQAWLDGTTGGISLTTGPFHTTEPFVTFTGKIEGHSMHGDLWMTARTSSGWATITIPYPSITLV